MSDQSAFEQKLSAASARWQAEFDKIKARAAESEADARIEAERLMSEIGDWQRDAGREVESLKLSGEKSLEEMRLAAEKAGDDIRSGVRSLLSKLG